MRRDVSEARSIQRRYGTPLEPAPGSLVHSQMSCILPVLDRVIDALEALVAERSRIEIFTDRVP